MMHEMMMAAMLVFYVVTAYCLMGIAQKTSLTCSISKRLSN